jgi:hypothetical protein
MHRLIIAAAMALASTIACADTARIDGRIISTGMTTADILDRVGPPSRIVQLENAYGAGVGERWEYHRKGRQHTVWISGGKAYKIEGR